MSPLNQPTPQQEPYKRTNEPLLISVPNGLYIGTSLAWKVPIDYYKEADALPKNAFYNFGLFSSFKKLHQFTYTCEGELTRHGKRAARFMEYTVAPRLASDLMRHYVEMRDAQYEVQRFTIEDVLNYSIVNGVHTASLNQKISMRMRCILL